MREYQLRSVECYVLPRPVYYQCIWIVRDMDRMRQLIQNRPESAALCREKLAAIDAALSFIPHEYRDGIITNIVDKRAFGDGANINTWKKWKQRFIFELATNLSMI